jgi:hypothetical protein
MDGENWKMDNLNRYFLKFEVMIAKMMKDKEL